MRLEVIPDLATGFMFVESRVIGIGYSIRCLCNLIKEASILFIFPSWLYSITLYAKEIREQEVGSINYLIYDSLCANHGISRIFLADLELYNLFIIESRYTHTNLWEGVSLYGWLQSPIPTSIKAFYLHDIFSALSLFLSKLKLRL